jgi:hypothetical protein
LLHLLKTKASQFKIKITSKYVDEAFANLIENIADRNGNVVILIDEYDLPFVNAYDNCDLQNSIHEMYRDFYYQIKSCEEQIHAVYITGISKYTKIGGISLANNITDFSNEEHFAAMFGYTHEEVVANFKPYIKATAKSMHMSEADFLAKLKAHYDGFAFSPNDSLTVYNPTSVHKFFEKRQFESYWIETGGQKFVENYIAQKNLNMADFEHYNITLDELKMPGEIVQSIAPALFLYQAGYLTPRREVDEPDEYYLTYPNIEIRTAMIKQFKHNFFATHEYIEERGIFRYDFLKCLESEDYVELLSVFNSLFSKIVFNGDNVAAKDSSRLECFYRNALYLFMDISKIDVRPEPPNPHGQVDLALHYKDRQILIELKVARTGTGKNLQAKLREAHEKMGDYARAYRNPIPVCCVISGGLRRIALASVNQDVYACIPDAKGRTAARFTRIGDHASFLAAPWKPAGEVGRRVTRRK